MQVHGLSDQPLPAVASLGVRPTVDDSGRVLLETHILDQQVDAWRQSDPCRVFEETTRRRKYTDLATLTAAINKDAEQARHYFQQRIGSATDRI